MEPSSGFLPAGASGCQPGRETGGIFPPSLGQPVTFPCVTFCSFVGAHLLCDFLLKM